MTSNSDDTFDLILLGAGTAGSLLASRLSSSASLRILMLESGQNHNNDPNVTCPGYSRRLLNNPKYDWQFQTQPEEGLNGRVILQPRGRLWGGSSAINSHALVYPSRGFHDSWGELLGGDVGEKRERWDWEGVGSYYGSFQEMQRPSESVKRELSIGDFVDAEGGDGKSGGIKASYPVTPHIFHKSWVDAIRELGYESSEDPRSGEVLGGSVTTNAIDCVKGERSHAGVEFLEPATKQQNLVVRSGALVEKILFDQEKKNGKLVATGVLYIDEESGAKVTVHARKEVIVCAGTFGSPKILELSGIGKRDVLSAAGINCLYELPGVGENLQDHLNFGPSIQVHDSIETLDATARDPALAEAQRKQYEESHTGPLAEMGAFSFSYLPLPDDPKLTALLNKTLSETTNPGLKAQYEFIARQIQNPNEATATVLLTRKQRYTPPDKPAEGNYMTVLAMLSHPFSRGSSHVTSTDPKEKPEIRFNYLSHPLDAEILCRHMLQINTLLTLPALSTHLKPAGNTLPPSYPRSPEASVEEIKPILKKYAATNYHPTGTCAMMSEELGGVVDGELRVYGTGNVRVVDASVMPVVPRGNVLSTVYAIAGKGADVILRGLGVEV